MLICSHAHGIDNIYTYIYIDSVCVGSYNICTQHDSYLKK